MQYQKQNLEKIPKYFELALISLLSKYFEDNMTIITMIVIIPMMRLVIQLDLIL